MKKTSSDEENQENCPYDLSHKENLFRLKENDTQRKLELQKWNGMTETVNILETE